MDNQEEFLKKFIKTFYNKAKTKRRSSKNQAHIIINTINRISSVYFENSFKFKDNEVLKSFAKNNFEIKENSGEDFSWERFHANSILASENTFIFIQTRDNVDLRLACKNNYPDNYKDETIHRLNQLKTNLKLFWQNNKHLVEN
jgi:hypothetical protein